MIEEPDPMDYSLEDWLQISGTQTGTATVNGVTYTNWAEVRWRMAHDQWLRPDDVPRTGSARQI